MIKIYETDEGNTGMKKKKRITRKFYDPLYFADVRLEFGISDSPLSCWVQKHQKGNSVWYVVFMENKEDFYGLLHECVHLVKHVFADRGVPFTADNDEAIAYYMNWWFKTLWRASNKYETR